MTIILEKLYSDESILDLEEDITDAINQSNLIRDQYGFHACTFKVTIEALEYRE